MADTHFPFLHMLEVRLPTGAAIPTQSLSSVAPSSLLRCYIPRSSSSNNHRRSQPHQWGTTRARRVVHRLRRSSNNSRGRQEAALMLGRQARATSRQSSRGRQCQHINYDRLIPMLGLKKARLLLTVELHTPRRIHLSCTTTILQCQYLPRISPCCLLRQWRVMVINPSSSSCHRT